MIERLLRVTCDVCGVAGPAETARTCAVFVSRVEVQAVAARSGGQFLLPVDVEVDVCDACAGSDRLRIGEIVKAARRIAEARVHP